MHMNENVSTHLNTFYVCTHLLPELFVLKRKKKKHPLIHPQFAAKLFLYHCAFVVLESYFGRYVVRNRREGYERDQKV